MTSFIAVTVTVTVIVIMTVTVNMEGRHQNNEEPAKNAHTKTGVSEQETGSAKAADKAIM